MPVMRQPRCEWRTVVEDIGLLALATFQLLLKSLNVVPKLQHFFFLLGKAVIFAFNDILHAVESRRADHQQLLF